jgi:hypothetical protein
VSLVVHDLKSRLVRKAAAAHVTEQSVLAGIAKNAKGRLVRKATVAEPLPKLRRPTPPRQYKAWPTLRDLSRGQDLPSRLWTKSQ